MSDAARLWTAVVLTIVLFTSVAYGMTAPASNSSSSTTTTVEGAEDTIPEPEDPVVDLNDSHTDEISGNLAVSFVEDWEPTFNDIGDMLLSSTLCTFFDSETEAYAWLNGIMLTAEEDSSRSFAEVLNARYRPLRVQYWQDELIDHAAANMMTAIEEEKPWLPLLVNMIVDDGWNEDDPGATMALVSELTYTDVVAAPASFRTTFCDNSPGLESEDFRTVEKGHNVVISPDDSDWVPTLVDVVLPSRINQYLRDSGSDIRVRQVAFGDNETTGYEIVGGEFDGKTVTITGAVPVIIHDETDQAVYAEGLFSTACGNLMLPEYTPPRKTPPPATTTTTEPSTTTTQPPVTTTTHPPTTTTTQPPVTTTTQPPTTTTTVPPTTTTTMPPTTTTTMPPTTTTTQPPTTTTTVPPTTTTTMPPEDIRVTGTLKCHTSETFAYWELLIDWLEGSGSTSPHNGATWNADGGTFSVSVKVYDSVGRYDHSFTVSSGSQTCGKDESVAPPMP